MLATTAFGSIRVETSDLESGNDTVECMTCDAEAVCTRRVRVGQNRFRLTPRELSCSTEASAVHRAFQDATRDCCQLSVGLNAPLRC